MKENFISLSQICFTPFFFICLELSLSPTFVNLLRLLHEEKCWSFFLSYFVAVACVIQFCHQQQSEPQPQPQQRKAITWIIQTTWTSKQTNKQKKKDTMCTLDKFTIEFTY